MEWLAMIFPLLGVGATWIWFNHKFVWWEAVFPLAANAIFILVFKWSAEHVMTSATEYWGGYVTTAEYYEPWNEYISRTCTRTVSCGENCTRTETYDCSYVEWHSARWILTDNNGITFNVDKSEYNRVVKKFGVVPQFVDMRRPYHTQDGDKYVANYLGPEDRAEIVFTSHSYENRVQASSSVFNFQDVPKEDVETYGLYEHPRIKNRSQNSILGMDNPKAERQMELLNGFLGREKQVRAFILLFDGQPKTAGELQEMYWKGGNKNEFTVCIGTSGKMIKWVKIISWNTNKKLDISVRNWLMESGELDIHEFIKYLRVEISNNFSRKSFSEFSYLQIELTTNQIICIWIFSVLITVGLCVWIVHNEIT
jgi:hypothetical protein